jgi:hypothetical protein
MSTIEEIYAAIVKEGVKRGHHVVPEFSLTPSSRLFQKKIDVTWLEPRDEPERLGSLRHWKIIAAFEIEGYDVPVERILVHSAQFRQIHVDEGATFPCIIPLYSRASHRSNPNWGNATPEAYIRERADAAIKSGNYVQVCDGRRLQFLETL